MKLIKHYFPDLNPLQIKRFEQLGDFYKEWNSKINVISRKDIDHLYLHHILHSLSIGKVIKFKPYTQVIDIGTGGGFPGIPLAILFPYVRFTLVDRIGKKIKVVNEAIQYLELNNTRAFKQRAQDVEDNYYDFLISRAVTDLSILKKWGKHIISKDFYNPLPNGILVLKGGDLSQEITKTKGKVREFPISTYFEEDWFKEKYVLHTSV